MRQFEIRKGNSLNLLRKMRDGSVNCCVTSPPYWGLRNYGLEPSIWGGDAECKHAWEHARYYIEGGSGRSSIEAFSKPGEGNAARIKAARWREDDTCSMCGAWRGCFGLEPTPALYVEHAVLIFREVNRVLTNDGTLWLNLGDSYNAYNGAAGPSSKLSRGAQTTERPPLPSGFGLRDKSLKPKDLVGIPWMTAFALRADGWYLRSEIIWHKRAPMPESVEDRPTRSHEQIFLLAKSQRYFYDSAAIAEPLDRPEEAQRKTPAKFGGALKFEQAKEQSRLHSGNEYRGTPTGTRNKRDVWTLGPSCFPDAHFATFPPKLIEPCILAGCPEGGTVLDPFSGAGTTGLVALRHNRHYIGIELNPAYVEMSRRRILDDSPLFNEEVA